MVERVPVTCVVPVFNGERYLAETLDSILRQAARPSEILVVDDGSTDASFRVVARYKDHVKYVRKDRGGPASARNLGIRLANNELVSFLDQDDLWHPRKLEVQLSMFKENAELGFCRTWWQNFCVPELDDQSSLIQAAGLLEPSPGPIQTMLVHRSVFDQIGLLDESKIHRDSAEFLMRARQRGIVNEVVEQVLLFRRLHLGNASRNRGAEDAEELFDILQSLKRSDSRCVR